MLKYKLDAAGDPVPCQDVIEWARWFERADRTVRRDTIDGVTVSTVFLGIDHSFGGGAHILYETMIFGGPHDGKMWRYSTRHQSIEGHKRALELVKKA